MLHHLILKLNDVVITEIERDAAEVLPYRSIGIEVLSAFCHTEYGVGHIHTLKDVFWNFERSAPSHSDGVELLASAECVSPDFLHIDRNGDRLEVLAQEEGILFDLLDGSRDNEIARHSLPGRELFQYRACLVVEHACSC